MRFRSTVAAGLVALSGAGCNLLAPACLAQQERHASEPRTARIAAGELVVVRLPYDTRGSQNDVEIDWSGRVSGTRLTAYATRAECEAGPNREAAFTANCRVLAQGGTGDGGGVILLVITHGRGNPYVLGDPPAFKIWLYGDPILDTIYTLTASSFYGPDC